jgi:RNA polymerase sigma-70 factor, ECF subfamily
MIGDARPMKDSADSHLSPSIDSDARALFHKHYVEIRRLAEASLRRERSDHTLQPTALAHEVFLRLAASRQSWGGREEFLAAAASLLRRVLIDHARRRKARKRGGLIRRASLWSVDPDVAPSFDEVIDLDQALRALEAIDPRRARVAELRLFAGLGNAEIGVLLGMARSTIAEDWALARAWLSRRLFEEIA